MDSTFAGAVIGACAVLLAAPLAAVLKTARTDLAHAARLRALSEIGRSGVKLDRGQLERIDFEMAWSASRLAGLPASARATWPLRIRLVSLFASMVSLMAGGMVGSALSVSSLEILGLHRWAFGGLGIFLGGASLLATLRSIPRWQLRVWLRTFH